MFSVYIGSLLPKYQYLDLLFPNIGAPISTNSFGEPYPFFRLQPIIKTVAYASDADACLYPYPYNVALRHKEHFESFMKVAVASHKPIIVAALGDQSVAVDPRVAIVLRTSGYQSELSPRDIIVPPTVADIGTLYGVLPRRKEDIPVVGFCGYAGFEKITDRVRFLLKDSFVGIGALFSSRVAVRRQGISYRQRSMRVLSRSRLVRTAFVTRPFFSGSAKTIGMDPHIARREYIENMQQSDFVLAPKGDGNYSLRFFEALSLGRIPILIDTDVSLPGSDEWYKDVCVRVSWRDIGQLPKKVSTWYHSLSDDEYGRRQEAARALFVERVFAPVFYTALVDSIRERIRVWGDTWGSIA